MNSPSDASAGGRVGARETASAAAFMIALGVVWRGLMGSDVHPALAVCLAALSLITCGLLAGAGIRPTGSKWTVYVIALAGTAAATAGALSTPLTPGQHSEQEFVAELVGPVIMFVLLLPSVALGRLARNRRAKRRE